MERGYEKTLGTALVAVGVGLLLFGFFQAYNYTQSPPSGKYIVVSLSGGGGNNSVNGTFNGRFLEAFTFLVIEYLVGASILRAGWNLITPKAETIQVRVKPRSLQVEPIPPMIVSAVAAPPVPPAVSSPPSGPGGAAPPT
jgi:hypothetical protein